MNFQRREVYFTGRVQGVGFRYTTHRIATGLDITGFVQNLVDGRVLLLVEGPKGEVDACMESVRAEMGSHIHGEQELTTEPTGEFGEFSIRH